jgi:hypothetical protein
MQDQPDQLTLPMSNRADSLIVSQARHRTTIHNLEDTSFGFCGGDSRLIRTYVSRDRKALGTTAKLSNLLLASATQPG